MADIPPGNMPRVPLPAPGEREPSEPEWMFAVDRLLANMDALRVHFQPIVDLQRGMVAGYETLATFETIPRRPPNEWFAAAARSGVGPHLDAAVMRAVMRARLSLPPNCFLTVNVDPNTLGSRDVVAALSEADDLRPLVLELTEHAAITDYTSLRAQIAALRARGATIAVDDAGAGYASLSHVLRLRPEFVKVDRAFIDRSDQDPAKEALIEMLGQFASRLDSWIIAEGIERPEELDVVCRLQVPLGQGYLLGRAAPVWTGPPLDIARRIRDRSARHHVPGSIAPLIELAPAWEARTPVAEAPGLDAIAVTIDEWSRPVGLIKPGASTPHPAPMLAGLGSNAHDLLQRAMARPRAERFDPIVCCRDDGTYAGIVRVEVLVTHATRTTPEIAAASRP